jgi:hypothetical protein
MTSSPRAGDGETRRIGLRVLVCGGRGFADGPTVYRVLDALRAGPGIALLIEGGSRGTDDLAHGWAKQQPDVPTKRYFAQWALGRRAGPMRNAWMLEDGRPDLVVAFPGGKGTADMIAKARAANVEVLVIHPERHDPPQEPSRGRYAPEAQPQSVNAHDES